jgi:hypothetical protein
VEQRPCLVLLKGVSHVFDLDVLIGMMRWKRLFSSMEVLVGPTIQKALAPRENPPTPKIPTKPS